MDIFHINLASRAEKSYSTRARWALRAIRKYVLLGLKPSGTYSISPAHARAIYHTAREAAVIRALASARGSVATRRVATGPRARRARGQGHGHSRARRAREWPKHASPRARRARGRAKLSARLGACQCYYMFFTTQLKITKFMGRSQDLNVG